MKNILICPLNWGIGHATRVKPIASRLMAMGNNVIIAAPDKLLSLYDNSTCNKKIRFSSISIIYSVIFPQYLAIAIQFPLLFIQYLSDLYRIRTLLKKHNIDILISDNRFGAFSRNIYSVYITHQLSLSAPSGLGFAARLASAIHRKIAARYSECWVPDIDGFLSSGLGSHNNRLKNTRDIGLLSMMSIVSSEKPDSLPPKPFHTVILSGPEPQRSSLKNILLSKLKDRKEQYVFACGKPGKEKTEIYNNITLYSYLDASHLRYVIENSETIICRAGYSTIMDLVYLEKSALLIPTPGQTEQEYLSTSLSEKGLFGYIDQSQVSSSALPNIPSGGNFIDYKNLSADLLYYALNRLIRRSSSQ